MCVCSHRCRHSSGLLPKAAPAAAAWEDCAPELSKPMKRSCPGGLQRVAAAAGGVWHGSYSPTLPRSPQGESAPPRLCSAFRRGRFPPLSAASRTTPLIPPPLYHLPCPSV
ncbi:hypothetical protein PICMEDRAFT_173633 [Pichia membranifaciens NRRL Y-2026]|uniref:Uncharacterized protein n=1 Tax=Pichia membranifaciens NRRL Y-2026 TaxID=763406 RepID=A0A1E3NEN0_9ASCO|nr:hypothetical protein PICMEDRAFT_173633 [Pichia membranifaciens NRRL Y-2026]ODQ44579.1 hypothetical protein PICMEDRAFT_173633 [Pichia membranifaciens NRRL Y-2026]